MFNPTDLHPYFVRSLDGGKSFATVDMLASTGAAAPRIAAVSPQDDRTVYLRIQGDSVDALAITDDGGGSFRVPLALASRMTAFVRLDDGTLIVGDSDGKSYRSTDGGHTFPALPRTLPDGGGTGPVSLGDLHLRALASRGGRLYAAASDINDPFAVGVSDDGGATFKPLLRFAELCGPLACAKVEAACAPRWSVQAATLGAVGSAACPRPDLGGAPAMRPDASAAIAGPGAGCGCRTGGRAGGAAFPGALLGALAIALSAIRLRRRARA
jgi:hypothetical protein